jgi:MFS family permease
MTSTTFGAKKASCFKNPQYLLLWAGQSISLIGDYFFSATIMLWIIDRLARGETWLPLATGGVAMAATLPALLLAPFAGVFVDRWERRWTMIWTDALRLLLVNLFVLMTLLVVERALLLVSALVMLVLVACGEQFFVPARVAVVADLVSAEQRPQAYGSLQQARYFAQILGPSLAAPLYSALGPTWAFVLNACSFLLSCLFTFLLRLPQEEKRAVSQQRMGFWQELSQGLHFFVGNRVLVTMLVSGMLFMCGGMAYNSFEYLYGVENLHIPGALLGVYVACYGVGVVVGLPAAAALAKRSSEVDVLWLFLVSFGVVMLLLSRVSTMGPGMICSVLLGIFSSSIFATVRPLTVLVTPRELIGRVMAFEVPLITVASLLGGLLASLLASTVLAGFHAQVAGMIFGRLDTIFVGVGLLTISAGLFARLTLYRAVKALRAQTVAGV